jgi:hypothetical protein
MELRIASPCPMSWDRMAGGNKVRFCDQCRLNVYNLAEMSEREIAAVVRKSTGRLCGRLYVRDDRTATLQDCPRGSARRKLRRMMTVGGVLLLAAFGWLLRISGDRDRSVHPRWVREVIEWIDPRPSGGAIAGMIAPPPPPRNPTAP